MYVCFAVSGNFELSATENMKLTSTFLLSSRNARFSAFNFELEEEGKQRHIVCQRATSWGNQPIRDTFFTVKSREQFFFMSFQFEPH